VATIKHAHHDFDIDQPGKDSHRHREAGASQVIVASARRVAHVSELRGAPEPGLDELASRLGPVDLVLVEGWKSGEHPRLELRRSAAPAPPIAGVAPNVLAIVSDRPREETQLPVLRRDDVAGITDFILAATGLPPRPPA
jgi:molybdopterin-guanine dinucleotide biosynthesis protein MobB